MQFSLSALRRIADSDSPASLANRLRARRFRQFESLTIGLPKPLRILDVGGENAYWENRGWGGRAEYQIFSLNLVPERKRFENVEPIAGDATNLSQFADDSFDIAFSNSVIEHLFNLENQRRMAAEMRRVAKAYWVQTPNFWFPLEPHFHIPGWQWMPLKLRVAMIRRWRCGWRGPCPDPVRARELVEEVRLLKREELQSMFPGGAVIPERLFGLVKSWTVIGGFPQSALAPGVAPPASSPREHTA